MVGGRPTRLMGRDMRVRGRMDAYCAPTGRVTAIALPKGAWTDMRPRALKPRAFTSRDATHNRARRISGFLAPREVLEGPVWECIKKAATPSVAATPCELAAAPLRPAMLSQNLLRDLSTPPLAFHLPAMSLMGVFGNGLTTCVVSPRLRAGRCVQ